MEVHNPNSPNVSRSAASSSERDSASPAPERSTSPSSSSGRSPASPDVPRCDAPSPESSGHDAQSLLELIAEKDRRIEAHETWLKLELRQSGHLFWEYDLATNRLRVLSHEPPLGVRETIIEDFPESAIANGDVHIDSFAPLRALTANMHAGVPEGGGTFFIADRQNGGYAWSSTSYRLVNDADGTPCRAIGVREDKPVRASGTLSSKEHEPVPVNVLMHLFCYVQYCVSTSIIDFMLLQGTDQTGAYQESSYEELIEWFAAMLYTEQEKDRFRQQAARARLVAEYRAGRRWSAERYRIVDENGIVRNMFFAVNMRRSAKTGNLLFLIYLSGIEARARWEAKASVGCVREQDTNLYPSSIASGIAQAVSSEASELSRSAIVLFSLQGLAALEERDRTAASNLRHDIALALGAFLDSDSILYTCGDDAIVAVLPEVKSQLEARQRIELAVNSARSSMEDERGMHDVKIVAVAVCDKTLNLDLEAHVARAQRACEEHGRAAADAVIVRCGEQDERNHRQMDCIAEGIENLDQARSLIDEGCYLCQGFYYDRPLPAEVFERKYLLGTAAG